MKFIPHDYQEFNCNLILGNQKSGLLLDMGLGKTASVLMAMDKLINHYLEVNKVLVIAPFRVAKLTWPGEIEKWDDFKNLRYSVVMGTEKQRITALNEDADIYIINRDNVVWLYNYLYNQDIIRMFDAIVVDESSSFKSPSSKRFKSLKKLAMRCPRVIILTGTPAPNGLMDLWSQIYLLDQGQRLGRTITEYRKKYFIPGRSKGHVVYDWVLKDGAEDDIYSAIGDICVSMKAIDHLDMPDRIDNIIEIEMDSTTKKLYKDLKRNYLIELKDEVITAATAGVLCNKLLQLANGALYVKKDLLCSKNQKNVYYEVVHNLKIEALEEILDSNPNVPILVFYNFKSDLDRLKNHFKSLEPKTLDDPNAYEDWNNKKIRLLLANPASMGHGLNMQAGGNIIVWFGLTYNLELYQQANARLYRQGQANTVIIHHLVLKGSEDEMVISRLQEKKDLQDNLIEYVKAEIRRIKNGKFD
ncbi:MAG: SNF2-related protein [Anaeroplasma sp.]